MSMSRAQSIRNFLADLKEKVSEPTPEDAALSRHIYDPVNVYSGFANQEDEEEGWEEQPASGGPSDPASLARPTSPLRRFARSARLFFLKQQEWFFLLVLGILSAILALTMEETMQNFFNARIVVIEAVSSDFGDLVLWILLSLAFAGLAGLFVHVVGPFAAGSGIPAMKSILSGVKLKHYLSFRTLVAKIAGIICAYAAGLFVGKEGPYVHICAALAYQLSRLRIFSRIKKNEALKFQMIAAGCAAGLAVTFGAPVGGVLFSIEVTTTYALVSNMSKSFFIGVVAALFVRVLPYEKVLTFFSQTYFEGTPYNAWELLPFCLIGIVFGLVGALFIKFVQEVAKFRRKYRILHESRYGQIMGVAFVTCLLTFFLQPLRMGPRHVMDQLFSVGPEGLPVQWHYPTPFVVLPLFIIFQLVFTAFSIGLPIPAGVVTPVFVAGAAGGRLVGEVLATLGFPGVQPAAYAVVGAAALTSGVTRTLATSLVVFELTGQLSLLLPVLLVVIIAIAVGQVFIPSIYDVQLQMKKLPYMPPFKPYGRKNVETLMRKDPTFLTTEITFGDLETALRSATISSFPLVQTNEDQILLGSIPRKTLKRLVETRETLYEEMVAEHQKQEEAIEAAAAAHREAAEDPTSAVAAAISEQPKSGTLPPTGPTTSEIAKSGDGAIISDAILVQPLAPLISRHEFFAENLTLSRDLPGFDPCPFQVVMATPLSKVHFMFAMLGLTHALVVERGKLVGVLLKESLMELEDEL